MRVLKLVINADEARAVVESVARHYLNDNGFTSQTEAHLALAGKDDITFLLNETNQIVGELIQADSANNYPSAVYDSVSHLFDLIDTALVSTLGQATAHHYTIQLFKMLDVNGTLEVGLLAKNG